MSYSIWAAKLRASSWDIFLRLNVIHLYQKTFSGWNEKNIWLDVKVLQRTIIDNNKYACNHNFKYHSWHCALIGLQLLSEQLKYINFISKLCFHCRYVSYWVYWSQYGFYGWVEVILPTSVQFHLDFWVASKLLKYPFT